MGKINVYFNVSVNQFGLIVDDKVYTKSIREIIGAKEVTNQRPIYGVTARHVPKLNVVTKDLDGNTRRRTLRVAPDFIARALRELPGQKIFFDDPNQNSFHRGQLTIISAKLPAKLSYR